MNATQKLIPVSRIAPATNTSPKFVRGVLEKLESGGEISPEWTVTGRGYLSIPEWEKVSAALAA